jgi:aminoglycoside phosphotransferase family enzyme
LEAKVAFLSDPKSYADGTRRVRAIETHFAWVFLTASHAYKLKKPLHHDGMNYRTLAGRRRGCLAELRLNRRLAPAVYEAVVPLSTDRTGLLRIGRSARIEDHLVKMRRLPSREMLDVILAGRSPTRARLDRPVLLLARFYRDSRRYPVGGVEYLARMRRQVLRDGRALARLQKAISQPLVREVTAAQLRYLASERGELARRGLNVVEGHGDLRAEHVYAGDPCCVIDCLEFNRELRLLDPAAEMAQLALDIARLGREGTASGLLRRFRRFSGDKPSEAVVQFYMSQGALTRAKLAANHVGDPQYPDPRPWIARARRHLRQALTHALNALRASGRAPSGYGGRAQQQRGDRLPSQNSADHRSK